MLLVEYLKLRGITAYAYSKEMDTDPQSVSRWLKAGWMVYGDELVSPKRKTIALKGE